MNDTFTHIGVTDLHSLIDALQSGRLVAPYTRVQVSHVVPSNFTDVIRNELEQLESQGFSPQQIARVLQIVISDRNVDRVADPEIEVVTSGPEGPGITNRDTSVVVRELFAHAKESVMVVGYAVYQGQQVFQSLANRMKERSDLDVQFFLNVSRPDRDNTASEILVSRFKQRFIDTQWPADCRLPKVYYDPRSVTDEGPVRSSLHATCVVVDTEHVFVSSANFTKAGQEENIEVGLKLRSQSIAGQLIRHFRMLQDAGIVDEVM